PDLFKHIDHPAIIGRVGDGKRENVDMHQALSFSSAFAYTANNPFSSTPQLNTRRASRQFPCNRPYKTGSLHNRRMASTTNASVTSGINTATSNASWTRRYSG